MTITLNGHIRKIICVIIIFLILFNPPIYKKLSFTTIFSVISLADNIIHIRQIKEILFNIKKTTALLIVFFIYYFIICLINSLVSIEFFSQIFLNLISLTINIAAQLSIALFIVRNFQDEDYTIDSLIEIFVLVGVIQGFIGILCFFSPAIKDVLNNLMIKNADTVDFAISLRVNSARRNYGFASTLFDVFGCTMSLLSVITFCRAFIQKRKIEYVYFVIISIVAVLNARTSIILILVGVALVIFLSREKGDYIKSNIRRFIILGFGITVGWLFIYKVRESSSESAVWLSTGIDEIEAFLSGNQVGYFSSLSGDSFIFFPDSFWGVLFGTALTPMIRLGKNTDIGYIQNIWSYGIIGSVLIYSIWFSLGYSAIKGAILKDKYKYRKVVIVCILAIILIYQIKLNTWGYSMAGVVYYTILLGFIKDNDKDVIDCCLNSIEDL